mmetsp:Transcript_21786/g.49332  ORF Transcript_21786/g.49332 Transcript_21786/m.49332 type:complete len:651 (-) Transcript_21786:138-2090(-)
MASIDYIRLDCTKSEINRFSTGSNFQSCGMQSFVQEGWGQQHHGVKSFACNTPPKSSEDSHDVVTKRGAVTGQMLRENFHLPLHTVAKKFGMCTTAFKKLCRRLDIPKWPHRQLRGIDKKIAALKTELTYSSATEKNQYLAGLSSLEVQKARLAQGAFQAGGQEGDSDDSESPSQNSGIEINATPPPHDNRREADAESGSEDASSPDDDERKNPLDSEGLFVGNVLTLRELRENFHLPLRTVAKKFGMCTTAFKKLCRRYSIAKWPHRQLRGIDKKIAALKAEMNYSSIDKSSAKINLQKLEEAKAKLAFSSGRDCTSKRNDGDHSISGESLVASSAIHHSMQVSSLVLDEKKENLIVSEDSSTKRVGIQNLLCDEDDADDDEADNASDNANIVEVPANIDKIPSNVVLTEDILRQHFHLPLQVVAKKFGMCTTAFKKLCRRFSIAKWPHRQLRGIDKRIAALKAELNYCTLDKDSAMRNLSLLEEEKARLSRVALGWQAASTKGKSSAIETESSNTSVNEGVRWPMLPSPSALDLLATVAGVGNDSNQRAMLKDATEARSGGGLDFSTSRIELKAFNRGGNFASPSSFDTPPLLPMSPSLSHGDMTPLLAPQLLALGFQSPHTLAKPMGDLSFPGGGLPASLSWLSQGR